MIIIKKPVITEKMTAISEKLNRFAFIVDKNVVLSARNIQRTEVMLARNLNTYDILKAKNIFLTESALQPIVDVLNREF